MAGPTAQNVPAPSAYPAAFFAADTHVEALARMAYLVEQGHRLGAIVGPTGSGKTLLLRMFAEQCRRAGRDVALINLSGLTGRGVLAELVDALCIEPGAGANAGSLWQDLRERISENRYQQVQTVVLADDADRADPSCLPVLERLLTLAPQGGMTIVCAVRRRRGGTLGRWLQQQVDLWAVLERLDAPTSARYVQHRLQQTGVTQDRLEPEALERLAEWSQGIPRRLNRLTDLVLAAAEGDGLQAVPAGVVDRVCAEVLGDRDDKA